MAVDVEQGWDACDGPIRTAERWRWRVLGLRCEVTEEEYEGIHCECWLEHESCCWCREQRKVHGLEA